LIRICFFWLLFLFLRDCKGTNIFETCKFFVCFSKKKDSSTSLGMTIQKDRNEIQKVLNDTPERLE